MGSSMHQNSLNFDEEFKGGLNQEEETESIFAKLEK